jgi:hypothetical protein
MRHRKPTHPITSDMRRELSVATLAKAGGFRMPMCFPLLGIETARDHIRIYSVRDRKRPPEIINIDWREMHFGSRPYFLCPRCRARRSYLYNDGLFCYCRVCADLWYFSQRVRRRTRLLHRSHRIRCALGDQTGKPGQPLPARPYRQPRHYYRRIIAKLRTVEQQYLHIVTHDRRFYGRERDELGRLLPTEKYTNNDTTEDLGRER